MVRGAGFPCNAHDSSTPQCALPRGGRVLDTSLKKQADGQADLRTFRVCFSANETRVPHGAAPAAIAIDNGAMVVLGNSRRRHKGAIAGLVATYITSLERTRSPRARAVRVRARRNAAARLAIPQPERNHVPVFTDASSRHSGRRGSQCWHQEVHPLDPLRLRCA